MATLPVPGAVLDHRVVGNGALLVLIAGARGSGDIYRPLAQQLSQHVRGLTYDHRGYGASTLDGEQDYTRRLQHQVAISFADHLGTSAVVLPGGHVGYLTYPAELAGGLAPLLENRVSQAMPAR